MDRGEGTVITAGQGSYCLGRRLGRGGMAEVFAATAIGAGGFERPVCVKFILPELAANEEFRELFLKEVRIAGRLCHANLVQVFDCFEDGEHLGMVMELVDGCDLRVVIRLMAHQSRTMPSGLVTYVGGQMLLGLAAAHRQRVVHRDISPHNVLVSWQGEIKITDFGVAKAMVTHATRTKTIRGKLAYMSPEQARARKVDHRTDLYSTGLVLWELAKGERYIPRNIPQWKLITHVLEARRPTVDFVEPALARVIERLLEPDPERRFSSAEEALAALPPSPLAGPGGATELASFLRELGVAPHISPDPSPPSQGETPRASAERKIGAISMTATTPIDRPEMAAGAPSAAGSEPRLSAGHAVRPSRARPSSPAGPQDLPPTTVLPSVRKAGEFTAVTRSIVRPTAFRWTYVVVGLLALLLIVVTGLAVGALVRLFLTGGTP